VLDPVSKMSPCKEAIGKFNFAPELFSSYIESS
jgi:hypothetical protein